MEEIEALEMELGATVMITSLEQMSERWREQRLGWRPLDELVHVSKAIGADVAGNATEARTGDEESASHDGASRVASEELVAHFARLVLGADATSPPLAVLITLLTRVEDVCVNRALTAAVLAVAEETPDLDAIIRKLICEEVYASGSRHLLFCRFKPVSMLLEAFVDARCAPLLEACVGPIVADVTVAPVPHFLPGRARSSSLTSAELARNDDSADSQLEASVLSWSLRLLDTVTLSAHLVPAAVVGLFVHLRATMAKQYPDQPALHVAPVVVVLLLRYLVRAVADPAGYGLIDARPSPGQTRVLRAVARKFRAFITWFLWRSNPSLDDLLQPSFDAITSFFSAISLPSGPLPEPPRLDPGRLADRVVEAWRVGRAGCPTAVCSLRHGAVLALGADDAHPADAINTLGLGLKVSDVSVCTRKALGTFHQVCLRKWPILRTGLELRLPTVKPLREVVEALAAKPGAFGAACSGRGAEPDSPHLLVPALPLHDLVARMKRPVLPDVALKLDDDKSFTGAALVAWIQVHTSHGEHYYASKVAQELLDARLVYNVNNASDSMFSPSPETQYRLQEDEPARVLNRLAIFDSTAREPLQVARALVSAALVLFDHFGNMRGDVLARHLKVLRSSAAFRAFALATTELQGVVLDGLTSQERTAFYINVYNVAYMHASMISLPPSSPPLRVSYEKKVSYQIGPLGVVSLFEIEHALLRAGAPATPLIAKYHGSFPRYDEFEPQAAYACEAFESRLAFALSHGCLSSPLVSSYSAKHLSQEMYDATAAYVRENAVLDVHKQSVTVPGYMRTYACDIGTSHKDILYFVLQYASPAMRASLQSMIHSGLTINLLFAPDSWHAYYSVSVSNAVLPSEPQGAVTSGSASASASGSPPDAGSGVLGYSLHDPRPPKVYRGTGSTSPREIEALDVAASAATNAGCPELIGTSSLFTPAMLSSLWSWIPRRYTDDTFALVFQTQRDGYNMETLLRLADNLSPLVLVLQTTRGAVVGAYLSTGFESSSTGSFSGSGETFIFSLHPDMRKYTWRPGRPAHFVRVTDAQIAVGGGGGVNAGYGLWIDSELLHGGSVRSRTFANDPLVAPDTHFECTSLELWAFSTELPAHVLADVLERITSNSPSL
ncbi:glycoside hydrolase, family 15:P [Thecamonas trahens ATCC 50062]|uniref:Oxidation resistance protein 1 n=1 Tax=Thecamonas trahens ATCC 50062 TaxID=461836 RepID=A0A0L0DNX6_THETB|nr:glycoside hydrolase, family 15:P [Thecamonas trahens ATCC 50062]KNC53970.1 glycoside hydrolase, family 15:P [Thecamonas trahens ATCC 50062]|eukprot:XP_013754172.1 glycoside hydrolase, family 15:P [Thecamonas trahens ATCC 50062]